MDENAIALQWYDYLLKGIANDFAKQKAVKLFVMGSNVWREEDDWPLARAQSTKYYLHSSGKANSIRGDGGLSTPPAPRHRRRASVDCRRSDATSCASRGHRDWHRCGCRDRRLAGHAPGG